MPDCFFVPVGDGRYTATEHTAGPWDPQLQHAGPPSALLTRAVEQTEAPWPAVITRVGIDILGPVPVGEVVVRASVLRSGRSVELVGVELEAGGRTAARAAAWRVREADLDLPATEVAPAPAPVPAFPEVEPDLPAEWTGGFLRAMQWREAAGAWGAPGPATVWGRMRHPLVGDEEPTGVQRVMILADCGNGASAVLPLTGWFFINPDLTVHFAARPTGEWMCLDAATTVDPAGFGLASSRLFDRDRLVALGAQSLYVGPR